MRVEADAVCYALFIYLLNLFLAFLTPKFDPALEADLAAQDVEEGEPGLPTSAAPSSGLMSNVFHGAQQGDQDEFRPFIRRLPEFKVGCGRLTPVLAERDASHGAVHLCELLRGVQHPRLLAGARGLLPDPVRADDAPPDPVRDALTQAHDPVQVPSFRHWAQGALRLVIGRRGVHYGATVARASGGAAAARGFESRPSCARSLRTYTTRYDVAPVGLGQCARRTRAGPRRAGWGAHGYR